MSRWVEQFNNHAFQNSWSTLKQSLKDVDLSKLADDNALKEFARLKKATSYLGRVINGIDPELFPESILNNANQHATNCNSEVRAFISNNNSAHLQNANAQIDILITVLSQAPNIPAGKQKTALLTAATEYNRTLDEYLSILRSGIDETVKEYEGGLEALKETISAQAVQVQQTNAKLAASQQTIESLTGEFQTQFQASQATRQSEFDSVLDGYKTKVEGVLEGYRNQVGDEFKDLASKASTTLGVLSQLQADAETVFGVVVNTAQAGAYKSYANEEKRTANAFRYIAILLMLLAAAFLVVPEMVKLFSSETYVVEWQKILSRLPISLVLFAPAFYMARESTKHRENEFRNKRRELILATIDPFLALLDNEDEKDEIKKEVAKSIFSDTPYKESKSDTGDLLAQLSNLVNQITKLAPKG